jgi:hypothetical protein
MKKLTITAMAVTLVAALFSCGGQTKEKQAREGAQSVEVQAIMLAKQNAAMGYESQNPIFLLSAAQLLIDHPGAELEFTSVEEAEQEIAESKGGVDVKLNAMVLLEDALLYAHGDPAVNQLAGSLKLQAEQTLTRGAVGGPYYIIRRVEKYATNRYSVTFRANEWAEVAVIGDGDTDLDLYVFDSNGNLIEYDEDYTDQCYVSWIPRWTGEYTIVVKNLGSVYNRFALITN